MTTITAEHFTLTTAIRTHAVGNLSKLGEMLPNSASIKVFLSKPAHKTFMVLCKVRVWGKDFIIREEDEKFCKAVETARVHLIRKIVDEKHRWVRLRRKNGPLEGLSTVNANFMSAAT